MKADIRTLGPDDVPDVVSLIREFAAFEDLSKHCEITEDRLSAALFGEHAVLDGIVAVDADQIAGYALFFPNFSSFRGQRGFYLDDIYLREEYRGTGLGSAMLKEIARLGAKRGYERIDFLVLDWNSRAADFYLRLGAIRDDQERHFKFTDDAFQHLAS
jgi:GNAT superfamily N-acetyltransferase